VDTLFEIGGQDAKYTFITNGVPADYAMNEACSAGTGSFLEESAFETLGIRMEEIADIALRGRRPPNFNDQCAAFISSDIKTAIHEGIPTEEIVAGLVYSICMNYTNRVKGHRAVGRKIFMQGGVCYNRAVPMAMASLIGNPIIVPPQPGLMGAFGVALEIKRRIGAKLMARQFFDLQTLINRDIEHGKSFVCRGGKEKCDRRCDISTLIIEGRPYPFGGACNRYYNLRRKISFDVAGLDLVRTRQHLIFTEYGGLPETDRHQRRKRIGINRSFMVNTYYPLYAHFFSRLGFEPVLPEVPSQEGIDRRNAAFCYPAELAHGFFLSLLQMDPPPDYIFLPHFKSVPASEGDVNAQVCPIVQGESFYLQATFRDDIERLKKCGTTMLQPLLDMTRGLAGARQAMVDTAVRMGCGRPEALLAFENAVARQTACQEEMQRIGARALADLEADPTQTGVVIFARPYNGMVEEAHMGIPHKLASRGIRVIPFDFLPLTTEKGKRHMYWGMGQMLLRSARLVRRHPQLFGTYITNFSCGPDSFVVGYFRSLMGIKPSLTLELDSHTADAGLETRIEAFLDIVAAYRQIDAGRRPAADAKASFVPARLTRNGDRLRIIDSGGRRLAPTDPRVTLLFPSMGRLGSESLAAVFRSAGFNARAHPPAGEAVLKLGRAHTSCKECLPLILTTGALLDYIRNGKRPDEMLLYFMPTGSGPCRFGQYAVFLEDLIRSLKIPNVALLTLSSENSYAGMGNDVHLKAWWAVVVSDVMEDIRAMLLTNAVDTARAMQCFEQQWEQICTALSQGAYKPLERQLTATSQRLSRIALKRPPAQVPLISLTGEIFVRRDGLSRQHLTERLAAQGFAAVCTPVAEWMHYSDYLVQHGLSPIQLSPRERLAFALKKRLMGHYERRLKRLLARSGLVSAAPVDIERVIDNAAPFLSPALAGEAILTIGGAITDVATHVCGVIAIGPFGCMPNRMSEAILNEVMTRRTKLDGDGGNPRMQEILEGMDALPFLAIESDGSPFPQLISAKLETFCLRAERLHRRMLAARK